MVREYCTCTVWIIYNYHTFCIKNLPITNKKSYINSRQNHHLIIKCKGTAKDFVPVANKNN